MDNAVATSIPGRFQIGNSGYRLRVERRASIRAGLIADYDFSAPSHALLLPIIVENIHAASRARSHVDRTRAANTARRLLVGIPRKIAPAPSLASYRAKP